MADFNIAYAPTAKIEGGYSMDKNDKGGQTVFGLTRRDWPHWDGWAKVDVYVKNRQIALLNADLELKISVAHLFRGNYWKPLKLDLINNQQIANQAFDTAVNMGVGTSAKIMQTAANVTVDLNIGDITLNKINGMDAKTFYARFIALRKARYDAIIAHDPKQAVFKSSWYSRLTPYKN